MNKKAIFILLVAVVAAGLILSGCGKKDNPFAPTSASIPGTVGRMASQGPQVTSMTTLSGGATLYHTPTFDEIEILFNKDMNLSSINTNTVKLIHTGNVNEVLAYTVTPDVAGTRRAFIRIPTGWNDTYRYLVTVTPGVTDLNGNPLDGNGNAFIDPQDYYRKVFIGGGTISSTEIAWDFAGPTAVVYPAMEATDFQLTDSIYVWITDIDSVDAATLVTANFKLTTDNGTVVTLPATPSVYTGAGPTSYRIAFTGLGLTQATNYYFTVTTGIKDKKGNTLDGNGNGNSEAESIDRKIVKFRTYDPANNTVPSLQVVSATLVDAGRNLEIRFNRKMDPTTMNIGTIKLYDNSDKTGFIPGTMVVHPDTMGVNYSLENAPAGTNYLWVSHTVKDAAGYMLDDNGNGIAGETAWIVVNGFSKAADDFWHSVPYTPGTHYILIDDNAEGASQGWTAQRMWHHTSRKARGGIYSWHCANSAAVAHAGDSSYMVGNPPVATIVHDTLFLPQVDLTNWAHAAFYYDRWYHTDGAADQISIIYSYYDGTNWTPWAALHTYSGTSGWSNTNYNPPVGHLTRLAIAFDTDAAGNDYPSEGPYFDNLRVEVW